MTQFAPQAIPNQISGNNPLAKHFRQPAIFTRLISGGRHWPEGALDLPVTGKIPVYPMTTRDEITLKTPDALIDGTSVVNVIQSCCPNIKNAWEMPSVDVDAVLIAVRIASYGGSMGIESVCPHCKNEHEYDVNLSSILDTIQMPDYDTELRINQEISVKLKPMNYLQVSRAGSAAFEEQRYIQSLSTSDATEEQKKEQYAIHLEKLVELSIKNIVYCTEAVIVNSTERVTDPKYISEYYMNAETSVLKKLQDRIKEYADITTLKPMAVKCTACQQDFSLSINFDYASFFGKGF